MTNQVNTLTNQDAFEKWWRIKNSITSPSWLKQDAYEAWQAATQASEIEINSLKHRVAELESWKNQAITVESEWDLQSVGKALSIPLGHSIRANILPKIAELTASKNQLREALNMFVKDCKGEIIHSTNWLKQQGEKALSSTSTQSLAKHDNDVIERIATALENAEGEFKTLPEYVALVRGMKND